MLHICFITNAQLPMPDNVCVGSTKRYHVNDATVPSTYVWKINGITQSSVVHEIFVTWNTVGVYTITVQEENANGCKGQLEQGVVNVFAPPIPNAGQDATYCFEATPRLNGSGGNIYEWSPSTYLSNTNTGNPFESQFIFCILGALLSPQPSPGLEFAWYKIQSSFPFGDLKNELCPGAKTLFFTDCWNNGFSDFIQEEASSKSPFP